MPRLIDADTLHEKIGAVQKQLETDCDALWAVNKPYYKALAWARRIINEAITIEINSLRPHGRWIKKWQDIYCSECDSKSKYTWYGGSAFSKYCPNCGAKMDLEE